MSISQIKVFIVGGEKSLIEVLIFRLHKLGYDVNYFEDGEVAFRNIRISAPHLVICDVSLSDMSGMEFCGLIRTQRGLEGIPFVFLGLPDVFFRILEKGGEIKDSYLTKPVEMNRLLKEIERIKKKLEEDEIRRREEKDFSGKISALSVFDIVSILEQGKKSGILELDIGVARGEMYFKDGKILDATCEGRVGEDAAYEIFNWREGNFSFLTRDISVEKRIKASAMGLIMEGARLADEREKFSKDIPALNDILMSVKDFSLETEDEESKVLIPLLDGKKTVAEILSSAGIGQTKGLIGLGKLIGKGIVKPISLEESAGEAYLSLMRGRLEGIRAGLGSEENAFEIIFGKIIVAGVHRTGKSTFVRTLFSILLHEKVVEKEETDETQFGNVDFGRVRVASNFMLQFYGIPSESEFSHSWGKLCEGMLGSIFLLDATNPSSIDREEDFLEFVSGGGNIPGVVVVNKYDLSSLENLEKLKKVIEGKYTFDVIPCNATSPEQVRKVFDHLIEKIYVKIVKKKMR